MLKRNFPNTTLRLVSSGQIIVNYVLYPNICVAASEVGDMSGSKLEIVENLDPPQVEAFISCESREKCERLFPAATIALAVGKLQNKSHSSGPQLRSSGRVVDVDKVRLLQHQAFEEVSVLCKAGESLSTDGRGRLFVSASSPPAGGAVRTRSSVSSAVTSDASVREPLLKLVLPRENWTEELLELTIQVLSAPPVAAAFTGSSVMEAESALKGEVRSIRLCGHSSAAPARWPIIIC